MKISLESRTDARNLGTRSIKRIYQIIRNKNKLDSNVTKDKVQVNSKQKRL